LLITFYFIEKGALVKCTFPIRSICFHLERVQGKVMPIFVICYPQV